MANLMKFTTEDVSTICGHNGREHEQYSNTDIDQSKTYLNFSFSMTHTGKDFEHYKKIIGENYLYGRGSKREAGAITAASWVVSAPEEIIGDSKKEHAFFEGVFNFISERYGADNMINNAVHYDEAGAPHIHIMFVPVTDIDHDQIHFKTIRTKQAVEKKSGRYEFGFRYRLDENGQRIPLKNYSKISDYYDRKISANDVLNKLELQHFHKDLQSYLDEHGIEGRVITGATGGTSYSVKELKEFSQATGMNLKDIKELDRSKPILQSFVEQQQKTVSLEQTVREKNSVIDRLQTRVISQSEDIKRITAERDAVVRQDRTHELSEKIADKEAELLRKDNEITDLKLQVDILHEDLESKDAEVSSLKVLNTDRGSLERSIEVKDKTIESLQKQLSEEREYSRAVEKQRDAAISHDRTDELSEKLSRSNKNLEISEGRNADLEQKIDSLHETLKGKDIELDAKQRELDEALEKIKTLEAEKTKEVTVEPTAKEETWGKDSSWGSDSGWGKGNSHDTKHKEIIW